MLVPNIRDQQENYGFRRNRGGLRKQPYNKISFTYKP